MAVQEAAAGLKVAIKITPEDYAYAYERHFTHEHPLMSRVSTIGFLFGISPFPDHQTLSRPIERIFRKRTYQERYQTPQRHENDLQR